MKKQKNRVFIALLFLAFLFLISIGYKLVYTSKIDSNKNANCVSAWQCDSWTTCNSSGESFRQCKDVNNCTNSVPPSTKQTCELTPGVLTSYQDDYEKKLLTIGGENNKVKINFVKGIDEQNNKDCQYINAEGPACYYFNLSENTYIKFIYNSTSQNVDNGQMILVNKDSTKQLMAGIGPIGNPLDVNSSGFYIYPTNYENIFYILGGKKIENNVMSWKEIYFDTLKQDIVFYADAGTELGNKRKSFINIKIGSPKEYDINTNLPNQCQPSGKYKLNGISINNGGNNSFPSSLEFNCNDDGISYDSAVEVEPLAISNDFKTLHLFVHKYSNDNPAKDGVSWHYLFDLATGNIKFIASN